MQTYFQAVSSLPLRHHHQLPLGVPAVLFQSAVQQVTLAPGQEEAAGQAQEVVVHSGRLESQLLVPRGAELVAQQAEQLLDLRHGQHRFDVVGECTGVHLEPKKRRE